jgi:hypothetical protein
MKIYFLIGLGLILINVVCLILTLKLKREDFYFDNKYETEKFPYGFKLVSIIISVIVFVFCFIIEYLSSNCLPFLLIPVIIGFPLYYYFMFITNNTKSEHLHKKEFFGNMFALVSCFYLLFIPLAADVSLSHQLSLIISTNLPLLELAMIIYVHLFIYVVVLNIILYFDVFNYVIKKNSISSQEFRVQHSVLTLVAFIISGYISSIILNGQFLTYPDDFDFEKFQNIILIYQIFLSSITILISLNRKNKKAKVK